MATSSIYTLTTEEFEDSLDHAKASVMKALVGDGLLEEDVADKWSLSHTVIVRRKSVFKSFLSNLWKDAKTKEGESYYLIVGITPEQSK
ncbi:hypothetical protein LCGC14_1859510 [marine sediment metagenome]|uniref:Uncharacterized protein n=1 Tax=marine sediment metagenome TaxID=412755 RepID=A0A0F9G7T0_9ZZZZ